MQLHYSIKFLIILTLLFNRETLAAFIPARNFLKQFINSPSQLVFDVGANVGKKTDLYLANKARVVCIEPQPQCLEVLRKKFKNNKRVYIENCALASSPGRLEMFICSDANTISTLSSDWTLSGRFAQHKYKWDKKIMVDVVTLDHMIQKYGKPQFIKIDVENFELEVLKGLSQPVNYLSFEFSQEYLKNAEECLAYLQKIGFKYFNFAIGENTRVELTQWVTCTELIRILQNLIKEKDWSVMWGLWGDIYAKS